MISEVTLLQQRDAERHRRRLEFRTTVRARLWTALREVVPGTRVILFGSITKPGCFNPRSDIDLAFEGLPPGVSSYWVTAELMERLRLPVDVVLLEQCRFRAEIEREGESWML